MQVWLFLVTLLPEWQTVRSSVCVFPHGLWHREVLWPCSCFISLSHQRTPPDTENFLSPFFANLDTQTLSLFIPLFLNFRVDLCEDNCVSHRAAVASPCCEVQALCHLFEASITPLNTPRFSHKDTPVTGCYRNQCFFFWNFCWWHCSLRRVDGKCCWISCAISWCYLFLL